MSKESKRPFLASVQDFTDNLPPRAVVHYEYSAVFDDSVSLPEKESVDMRLDTSVRARPTGVDYRIILKAPMTAGELVVDLGMIFDAEGLVAFSREGVQAFGESVALPALFPYVRQGLIDLTSRVLGTAIELPLSPPHGMTVDVDHLDEIIQLDPEPESS